MRQPATEVLIRLCFDSVCQHSSQMLSSTCAKITNNVVGTNYGRVIRPSALSCLASISVVLRHHMPLHAVRLLDFPGRAKGMVPTVPPSSVLLSQCPLITSSRVELGLWNKIMPGDETTVFLQPVAPWWPDLHRGAGVEVYLGQTSSRRVISFLLACQVDTSEQR